MMGKLPLRSPQQACCDWSRWVPLGRNCLFGHVGLRDNGMQSDSGRQAEAALIFHIEMSPTQVRMDQIMPEIMSFVNVTERFSALTVYLAKLVQETDLF